MQITDEILAKLERLSALKIADEKRAEFKSQLGEIVNFVDILSELNLDDIDATVNTIKGGTPFRKDEPEISDVAKIVLENAPKRRDNYFEVPKIIE